MEWYEKVKVAVVAAIAGINSWLGILAAPVYILIVLNIMDYATGLTAAPYRGEKRNSYKGFRGIVKKVCMLLLVVLGIIVDWLIKYAALTIGITVPFKYLIACLVTIWLIANEILSILENISDIGVEMPGFLGKVVEWIKATANEKGELNDAKTHSSH